MVKMLKPRTRPAPTRRLGTNDVRDVQRTTGRALQTRRFRLWTAGPYCALCGRLCAYPEGFELDHTVPLYKGGPDTDENCQVLCVWHETVAGRRVKRGCHAEKTLADGSPRWES